VQDPSPTAPAHSARHPENEDILASAKRPGLAAPWRRLLGALADTIMPPVCIGCQEPMQSHGTLCGRCWRQIDFIRPPLCDRLGIPLPFDTGATMVSAAAAVADPAYDRARAVASYNGVMRKLVHDFKFNDRHEAASVFVNWLLRTAADLIDDCDVLIPVPLHRWRLLSRKYNQSAVLARGICMELRHRPPPPGRIELPRFDPSALLRVKATKPQVGMTRDQRRRNIQGAFKVAGRARQRLYDKRILLIDDVITTGSTANACARTLKAAGAARVDVLALAMVTAPTRMTT